MEVAFASMNESDALEKMTVSPMEMHELKEKLTSHWLNVNEWEKKRITNNKAGDFTLLVEEMREYEKSLKYSWFFKAQNIFVII